VPSLLFPPGASARVVRHLKPDSLQARRGAAQCCVAGKPPRFPDSVGLPAVSCRSSPPPAPPGRRSTPFERGPTPPGALHEMVGLGDRVCGRRRATGPPPRRVSPTGTGGKAPAPVGQTGSVVRRTASILLSSASGDRQLPRGGTGSSATSRPRTRAFIVFHPGLLTAERERPVRLTGSDPHYRTKATKGVGRLGVAAADRWPRRRPTAMEGIRRCTTRLSSARRRAAAPRSSW
jgi:hypothetical protein